MDMEKMKSDELTITEKAELLKDELTGTVKSYLSGFLRLLLVAILVLFQIFIIALAPFVLQHATVYLYVILEMCSFVGILNLVNDNRNPSYKIAWITIVLLLPISGYIMYFLWGRADSKKKIDRTVINRMRPGEAYLEHDETLMKEYEELHPTKSRMSKYMAKENFPLYKNNHIEYYSMGEEAFQAIFEELEKAEKFILINFFIIAEGAIWDKLHHILLKKIQQGVEVKFLYDDFGAALRTDKKFRQGLENEGFEVQVFNPIHRYTGKLYMNYRSHQKILVVDGNVGFTGGFNIADEYANLIERFGRWKDNGIRLEGDAVWGLTVTFLQMWAVCSGGTIPYEKYRPTKKFQPSDVYCHVISDGPANNPNNPIESIYKQMINLSKQYLYITTPYLVIEDEMKNALIETARSGVDVRIITPNIPDKKYVKMVTNYNYGTLLENGVRVYEYTPGFIHAKTIINEHCGIVGTINMDYRSFYLHYENGVWMSNDEVVSVIKADLLKTMAESREITLEEWKRRPLGLRMIQPILNLFSTLM